MIVQKRKRNPPSKELDELRLQLEFLYCIKNYTVAKICEEINAGYGLNVSTYQIRERLSKWGCRENLSTRQVDKVKVKLEARQGKDSEVVIAGRSNFALVVRQKRMERSIRRREQGIPLLEKLKQAVNVKAIAATDQNFDHHGPLVMFQKVLEHNDQTTQLSKVRSLPHFAVIRLVIWQLSNNLISMRHINGLLDKIEQLKCWKLFVTLLSVDNISIRAACETLIPLLYFRGHREIAMRLYDLHSVLKPSLYKYLELSQEEFHSLGPYGKRSQEALWWGTNMWECSTNCMRTVRSEPYSYGSYRSGLIVEILNRGEAPCNIKQIYYGLLSCHEARLPLSTFIQITSLNSEVAMKIEREILVHDEDPKELISDKYHKQSPSWRMILDCTIEDASTLMHCGFKANLCSRLLITICENDVTAAMTLLSHWKDSETPESMVYREAFAWQPNQDNRQKDLITLFDCDILALIINTAFTENMHSQCHFRNLENKVTGFGGVSFYYQDVIPQVAAVILRLMFDHKSALPLDFEYALRRYRTVIPHQTVFLRALQSLCHTFRGIWMYMDTFQKFITRRIRSFLALSMMANPLYPITTTDILWFYTKLLLTKTYTCGGTLIYSSNWPLDIQLLSDILDAGADFESECEMGWRDEGQNVGHYLIDISVHIDHPEYLFVLLRRGFDRRFLMRDFQISHDREWSISAPFMSAVEKSDLPTIHLLWDTSFDMLALGAEATFTPNNLTGELLHLSEGYDHDTYIDKILQGLRVLYWGDTYGGEPPTKEGYRLLECLEQKQGTEKMYTTFFRHCCDFLDQTLTGDNENAPWKCAAELVRLLHRKACHIAIINMSVNALTRLIIHGNQMEQIVLPSRRDCFPGHSHHSTFRNICQAEITSPSGVSFPILKILVENGKYLVDKPIECKGICCEPLLVSAVKNGDMQQVVYLLERGADMWEEWSWKEIGTSGAVLATKLGRIDMVALFIRHYPSCANYLLAIAKMAGNRSVVEMIEDQRMKNMEQLDKLGAGSISSDDDCEL